MKRSWIEPLSWFTCIKNHDFFIFFTFGFIHQFREHEFHAARRRSKIVFSRGWKYDMSCQVMSFQNDNRSFRQWNRQNEKEKLEETAQVLTRYHQTSICVRHFLRKKGIQYYIKVIPTGSMGLVYLPTFIIRINYSCRENIPYMHPMGYIFCPSFAGASEAARCCMKLKGSR